jgi:hypothetical protein
MTRVRRIQRLKVLLPNLSAKDVDPYAHWQNYLTSGELQELETMPRHSAQQVDRLIDIADAELGLCDYQTRELVYRLFKIG